MTARGPAFESPVWILHAPSHVWDWAAAAAAAAAAESRGWQQVMLPSRDSQTV